MNSKLIYGLVIFSSAFLLFQVQPVVGKMILPRFGGAAGFGSSACCSFRPCFFLATFTPTH